MRADEIKLTFFFQLGIFLHMFLTDDERRCFWYNFIVCWNGAFSLLWFIAVSKFHCMSGRLRRLLRLPPPCCSEDFTLSSFCFLYAHACTLTVGRQICDDVELSMLSGAYALSKAFMWSSCLIGIVMSVVLIFHYNNSMPMTGGTLSEIDITGSNFYLVRA